MPSSRTVQLQVDEAASRLDQYLVQVLPELSRTEIKKLIQQDQVLVSNQPAKPSMSVQPGDVVTVYVPIAEPVALQAETIPITIIYEDADLIVVNKPAGLVVHPALGHRTGTLVNALLAKYPDLGDLSQAEPEAEQRPGVVHRLDRDTSGLLVVARTDLALRHLRRQFKDRTVQKTYLALVVGRPKAPEGLIDVPLGRDPHHRQKFAPLVDGKPARTRFRLVEKVGEYSLLEVDLETGRTHQIRVHLAWLGCPVVGDTVYGPKNNPPGLDRQFLHAWRLGFEHPRHGRALTFEAPLDRQLETVLDRLRAGY
jgi:23S rRNA pseudouridine1911/1915/1917 synthase